MRMNPPLLPRAINLVCIFILTCLSTQAFADRRPGTGAVTLFLPYSFSKDFDAENNASVSTDSEVGFGVGIEFNHSRHLTLSGSMSWTEIDYKATGFHVPDDGIGVPEERTLRGNMDTWAIDFAADYYFTEGALAPFVNANLGWTFIDTNIPSGPPGTFCWWDPWWGYICQGYQETHTSSEFTTGLGAGVRLEIGRSSFVKLGYYNEWIDSEMLDSVRLELGFSF